MTGWQVAHVDVVGHLVPCHDGHMLWQHCQIEQRLYADSDQSECGASSVDTHEVGTCIGNVCPLIVLVPENAW